MSFILENTNRKISTCDLRFFYFQNNNKKRNEAQSATDLIYISVICYSTSGNVKLK